MAWLDKKNTFKEAEPKPAVEAVKETSEPVEEEHTSTVAEDTQSEERKGDYNNMEETKTPINPLQTMSQSDCTIISETAIIQGSITTESDTIIYGIIEGDVTCEGNLKIYGKVNGTITGSTIKLANADITGNINSTGSISLSKSTSVEGDIKGKELESEGRIKGNVQIEGLTSFHETAVMLGDVRTSDMEIHKGASIQGQLSMDKK